MTRILISRGQWVHHKTTQLTLLCVAVLSATYLRSGLGPLQETLQHDLRLTDNEIGMLQGIAMALPVLAFAFPIGFAIDRYSRSKLLRLLSCCLIVAGVCASIARSVPLLVVFRSITWIAASATLSAAVAMISELFPNHQRGRATMALIISQMIGNAAAFALGGELLSRVGSGLEAWRPALLWLTMVTLPIPALLFVLRDATPAAVPLGAQHDGHTSADIGRSSRPAILLRAGLLVAAIAAAEMAFAASYVWTAPLLARDFGFNPKTVGEVMGGALLLSGLVGPLLGGALADASEGTGGHARAMQFIVLISIVSLPAALFPLCSSAAVSVLLFIISMITLQATLVMGTTLCILIIPRELQGRCLSSMFAINTICGIGLSPVAVSFLAQMIGGHRGMDLALSGFLVVMSALATGAFYAARASTLSQ